MYYYKDNLIFLRKKTTFHANFATKSRFVLQLPFFETLHKDSSDYADNGTCKDSADKKHGKIIGDLGGVCPEARGDYLTHVMKDSTHDTDRNAGKKIRLFKKYHSEEAEHRACDTEGHGLHVSEEEGYKKYPYNADRYRLLCTYLIKKKHHYNVWKSNLNTGHCGKRRDLAFDIGKDHCK